MDPAHVKLDLKRALWQAAIPIHQSRVALGSIVLEFQGIVLERVFWGWGSLIDIAIQEIFLGAVI
jgi:hypothetical protein